jgi:hypothetical protein
MISTSVSFSDGRLGEPANRTISSSKLTSLNTGGASFLTYSKFITLPKAAVFNENLLLLSCARFFWIELTKWDGGLETVLALVPIELLPIGVSGSATF